MNRSGHTLVEACLATGMFLGVFLLAASSLQTLSEVYQGRDAELAAHRAVRTLLTRLGQDLRQVCYLYAGLNQSIDGVAITTAEAGGSAPGLVVALPESHDLYTVVVVFPRARLPADPANPDALDVVYRTYSGVAPQTSGLPSSIQLNTLAGSSEKIYDCYLTAEGLTFSVDGSAQMVQIDLWSRQVVRRTTTVLKHHSGQFAFRVLQ